MLHSIINPKQKHHVHSSDVVSCYEEPMILGLVILQLRTVFIKIVLSGFSDEPS